jgi:hypothetical protein
MLNCDQVRQDVVSQKTHLPAPLEVSGRIKAVGGKERDGANS